MARILIVDDDVLTRSFIGELLEEAGHEVGYATDGEQALSTFRKSAFDVVIVDLVLPSKNGVQVIREMKAAQPDLKIIAISGRSPEHLPMAEEAGAMAALQKPVDKQALLDAVGTLQRRTTGWEGVMD